MSAGPKQLKGKCVIQALFLPERGGFNEARARTQITPDPNNYISQSYYQQANSSASARLKSISQSGGGLTPHANPFIGAPMSTFIYGSLAPGQPHPQLNLIKGPASDSSYTDENGVIQTYSPKFTDPPARLSNITGEGSGVVDFKQVDANIPGSAQYPTVPATTINPVIGTGQPPQALPTYNIWKLINIEDGAVAQYKENQGPVYSSKYEGARVVQVATADGGMHLNVTAPNVEAQLRRIFPICKDLIYSNASLYYPKTTSEDGFGTGPDPKLIKARGGVNSGFQMHFSHSNIGQSTNNKGELNGGIKVKWGIDKPSAKDKIEQFVLHLNPNQAPELYYAQPENSSEPWKKVPLQGPAFGTGQYSVYVHFNGPQMMIGFEADPSNWNVIFPPDLIDSQTGKPNGNYRYINLTEESYVSVIFTNITTTFTYGPMAFNNYHPENWKKGLDHRGTYKFNMSAPVGSHDHLASDKINKYIQDHKYSQDDYITENLANQDQKPKVLSPSYYTDRRSSEDHIIYQELNRVVDDNNEFVTVTGQIVFDTTIEGPQFHWVRATTIDPDRNTTPPSTKKPPFPIKSLDPWGDISTFLTAWTVNYQNSGENRSVLTGEATVTLSNLGLTVQGRKILNVLKRNLLVMTLSAGYDDVNPFFQGVVTGIENKKTATGTETVVTLIDVASYLIKYLRFDQITFFGTMKYGDIIMTVMEMSGLLKTYQEQIAAIGEESSDEPFQGFADALNTRLQPILLEQSLAAAAVHASPLDVLEKVIKPVLSLIIGPSALPSFRWDPEATEEKYIKLSWRNDSAFVDRLFFAGFRDENNLTFLPSTNDDDSFHGVLDSGGWTEVTKLSQLYAGLKMYGKNNISRVIVYDKIDPQAYGESAYQSLLNSISDDSEDGDTSLGYVGAPIVYVNETKSEYIGDQKTLDNYGDLMLDGFLRQPYEQIRFGVFVEKPLTHYGRFYISTFYDSDEQQDNKTDTYYYKNVSYNYSKADGILTANVIGEIIPSLILQGKEDSITVGVDLG